MNSRVADAVRIGRYVVQGVLGRGAMGVIYRAHDPDIDRVVAVKLIRADLLEGEDRVAFLARFRREAQAAGRCAHPNIVAVHDFALHEGNPYLAMEFVDGMSLAQRLQDGRRMEAGAAVAVILQVLEALEAAHGLGVVHRDIKPANILLVAHGRPGGAAGERVKVADFGISRLGNSTLTGDAAMLGTPSYMAPEQCRGAAVDARTDLFSVGVVLFEMLAGVKPFAGAGVAEVLSKLLHAPAPALAALSPGLPPAVCAAVARSLEKAPEDRFDSAGAMAVALRAAVSTADATVVARGMPKGPVPEAEIVVLERALAAYVGPVARILIKRARAGSLTELWHAVALHIEDEEERAAFLRGL